MKALLALVILCAAGFVIPWRSEKAVTDPKETKRVEQVSKRTNGPKEASRTSPSRVEGSLNSHQALNQQPVSLPASKGMDVPQSGLPAPAKVEEPQPARAADEQPIKHTHLNLKLQGVAISGNQSSAVILDGETHEENIYYVGDMIHNATITQILSDRVIFDVNNEREELRPTSNQAAQQAASGRRSGVQPLRPALVEKYPPPDPKQSSLGEEVASRLPAMLRQKRRTATSGN